MNYHTDIVNLGGAYFENLTSWRGAYWRMGTH